MWFVVVAAAAAGSIAKGPKGAVPLPSPSNSNELNEIFTYWIFISGTRLVSGNKNLPQRIPEYLAEDLATVLNALLDLRVGSSKST